MILTIECLIVDLTISARMARVRIDVRTDYLLHPILQVIPRRWLPGMLQLLFADSILNEAGKCRWQMSRPVDRREL